MNMKKNNKGFSLVELIVVIAIMAILAAVAVVGVSVYVPKAQQAKDRELVSDIEYALNLYAQSHAGNMNGGYVIITAGGTSATGDAELALNDVFGKGQWEDNKLASDEWKAGMIDVLAGYTSEQLNDMANSSYLTNSDTTNLMAAVDTVLDKASEVIALVDDPDQRRECLYAILAPDGCGDEQKENAEHIVSTLDDLDLMGDSQAISNMLVGAMADTLEINPALTFIMNDYAAAYSYSQLPQGNDKALTKMQENLGSLKMAMLTATTEREAKEQLYDGILGNPEYDDFLQYMETASENGTLRRDKDALMTMMGAVKEISSNFESEESLKNPDLYLTKDVMVQVDDYINAVKTLAGCDLEELQNLPEGANAVVVILSANGVILVYPGDASAS